MESSTTTVNIQSPSVDGTVKAIAPMAPKHTHGPNFGRYVEGCEACARKYPDGPGTRPTKRPRSNSETKFAALQSEIAQLKAAKPAGIAPEIAETITALMDQIEKLKAGSASPVDAESSSTDKLVELMLRKEGRAIEEEELKLKRALESREQMLQIEREHIRQMDVMQTACTHTKPNGVTAICASQVHNDGMVHPFCQRCFKTWPPRAKSRG